MGIHMLKENKINLNFLLNQPLVYQSSPLCILRGEISTNTQLSIAARTLLDTGASTNYISKKYCQQFQIPVQQYPEQTIQVRLGDNEVSQAQALLVPPWKHQRMVSSSNGRQQLLL